MLPTLRLSAKNQVSIPAKLRGQLGAGEETLYALEHGMPAEQGTEVFPLILLMTAAELERSEQAIYARGDLSEIRRAQLATQLRGRVEEISVDSQGRCVLPARFVKALALAQEVFFIGGGTAIQVWNPEHYRRFAGIGEDGTAPYRPELTPFIFRGK